MTGPLPAELQPGGTRHRPGTDGSSAATAPGPRCTSCPTRRSSTISISTSAPWPSVCGRWPSSTARSASPSPTSARARGGRCLGSLDPPASIRPTAKTTGTAEASTETGGAKAAARPATGGRRGLLCETDGAGDGAAAAKSSAGPRTVAYCYDGGIVDFVRHINAQKDPIHPRVIHFEGEEADYHMSSWPCSGTPATTTTSSPSPTTSTPTRAARTSPASGGHHPQHQRLRPLQGLPQGEGGEPQRRGRARGLGGHPQRQAAGAAVRGPDQDQAGQLRDPGLRGGQWSTRSSPSSWRRTPPTAKPDHQQDRAGGPRPHGRPQGAGPHPAQERTREHDAARQAGRLLHPRPGLVRDLPGRGRLRRRLGQAGPRPQLPGHPAAAGQDHQRGEGAAQQDPLQHRDPGHHQRAAAPAWARSSI